MPLIKFTIILALIRRSAAGTQDAAVRHKPIYLHNHLLCRYKPAALILPVCALMPGTAVIVIHNL